MMKRLEQITVNCMNIITTWKLTIFLSGTNGRTCGNDRNMMYKTYKRLFVLLFRFSLRTEKSVLFVQL